jgi:GT2 family glycosyltransferase
MPQNLSYEVIVSDSATQEDTKELMREEFPSDTFFPHEKNVGFGRLVNKALDHATGEFVFLINSDVILTPDSISILLNFLKQNSDVGIVGPKQLHFNNTLQKTCFHFYKPITIVYRRTFLKHTSFGKKHLAWFEMSDYNHKTQKDVDWIIGSAMMIPRAYIEKIGKLDTRFFMYMEDVDWCRRFWQFGYRVVYLPEAIVYHYYGKGSAKGGFFRSLLFNRLTWAHISSAIKYFWKYLGKSNPRQDNV